MTCAVGVLEGEGLLRYTFPPPHPFSSARVERFWAELARTRTEYKKLEPQRAEHAAIELFHSKEHVRYVELASKLGYGSLDEGDTPAFRGVLDAAQFVVGSTLSAVESVIRGRVDHSVNPVGGLHHARRDSSAGFCVFNDIGVAIEAIKKEFSLRRILYVDIDVHHGDGVYYSYESDPDVWIFDIHEDGRFLYPGTGSASETGVGEGKGTKVNIPLLPGASDAAVIKVLPRLQEFAEASRPEFIILQCGADGLANDPLGGLNYSRKTHEAVTGLLHRFSHEFCRGRIIALGGGGYDITNCAEAWSTVVGALRGDA